VTKGERIATLFGKDSQSLEDAFPIALDAISIGDSAPSASSIILEEITVS